ncbi:unnamed protein product [Rotaria socialis]|uniref:Malate synthase n=3 Tax=Rotaria socialis TaxID=392032 RepID=A0A820JVC7_9BILA|nr:unnamed protein product [Rotaria socialis]
MMANERVRIGNVQVAKILFDFVNEEVLPDMNIDSDTFWSGAELIIAELSPHRMHQGKCTDITAYKTFLYDIGYLIPQTNDENFQINTINVDNEISVQVAPQLAVPLVNARRCSLYDALYSTDAISDCDSCERTNENNQKRGEKVISFTRKFLDQSIPLTSNFSHTDAIQYSIVNGEVKVRNLFRQIGNQIISCDKGVPHAIVFVHHDLHIEIQIDRKNCRNDIAGIKGVIIESALTTIVDCEDSIAVVDVYDKIQLNRNWLSLMKDNELRLSSRSLLFVRHVGHLLFTDAILNNDNQEIPEGILDALITTLIAVHNLNDRTKDNIKNSHKGSIYIVKPKQHGPVGIMDEERRTTVNRSVCIRESKDRLVFIDTGFLDRTGDEMHTSMEAGSLMQKTQMKDTKWFMAYERNNVEKGLKWGLAGTTQIGKGMWALPDMMAAMIEQKISHLKAGATCAWVPSPTAAKLHALHYHQVDVFARQIELIASCSLSNNYLDDLLTIPILRTTLTSE